MGKNPSANYLIDESPLIVLPTLARALGVETAIFVQQLHYLLQQPRLGKEADGRRWVYNSLPQWLRALPFLSERSLRRIITSLESSGIVLSRGDLNYMPVDRTKHYTIDYGRLAEVIATERERWAEADGETVAPSDKNVRPSDETVRPSGQNGHMQPAKMAAPSGQNGRTNNQILLPDTSPDTSLFSPSPTEERAERDDSIGFDEWQALYNGLRSRGFAPSVGAGYFLSAKREGCRAYTSRSDFEAAIGLLADLRSTFEDDRLIQLPEPGAFPQLVTEAERWRILAEQHPEIRSREWLQTVARVGRRGVPVAFILDGGFLSAIQSALDRESRERRDQEARQAAPPPVRPQVTGTRYRGLN